MPQTKSIALVAHDDTKPELVAWVAANEAALAPHRLFATGTTGKVVMESCPSLAVTRMKSGPLGGDQQLGAMIAEGKLDMLIFFIDALSPHPHDVDVKALSRLATLYDLPMAFNRATADFLVSSPHFAGDYTRRKLDLQPPS